MARGAPPPWLTAILLLATLYLAWPLPVRAQLFTTPASNVTGVAGASADLQGAIQEFATTPNTGTAAAVSSAQNAYNEALTAAAVHSGIVNLIPPPNDVTTAQVIDNDRAQVVVTNGGALTFSLVTGPVVTNSGGFFLGPVVGSLTPAEANPASLPLPFTFSGNSSTANGGAIANAGTTTITNSSFTDNSAPRPTGATMGGAGGAIYNTGTATIVNSSFTDNSVSRTLGVAPVDSNGGAINNTGTVTIANSSFSGNVATDYGGAIYNTGIATITNSSFTGNSTALNHGGAIRNDGTATITNSSFSGNIADASSGAIYNFRGTATIANSSFSANTATTQGAGAIFNNGGTVTIAGSSFENNTGMGVGVLGGGAIRNEGPATIANSSFSGNSSGDGGAINNVFDVATITITNSSFTGNNATQFGGAIENLSDTATIANSSFSGNSATDSGGAIYNDESTLNLNVNAGQTSTFSGNTAAGQASSIFFDSTFGATVLNVNLAAGGLLEMRDPMGGTPTSVTETGPGVWALGGTNDLTGAAFSVNGGTLYLYAAGQVPNPTTGNPGARVAPGTITGLTSFILGSGATLVAAGNNSVTVTGGPITLANDATIRGGTAADASLLNVPLVAGGPASSLTLSATGGVGLQGQLNVKAIAPADTFTLNANLADASGSTGSLIVNGHGAAGTVILTGDNTYTGSTTINGGTLELGNDGSTGDINSLNIINNSTMAFDHDNANALPFPHNISGTGNVEQIGTGTTVLSGANTYTGATQVTNGILEAGAEDTLPNKTAVTVTTPGTLNLADFSQTIGSLAGNGSVTLGINPATTLTTGNDNTSTTFFGVISGAGGLTKIGSGTFTLSGANDYTGTTTVDGTLAAGGVDVFSAASHTVVEIGGTLALQGFNQTLNNGLVNGGTVQLPATPGVSTPGTTLTVAGNYVGNNGNLVLNTFLGADNSPSDKLVINGGSASGSTAVHIDNTNGPGALTVANGIPIVLAMNGATTDPPFALAKPVVAGMFDYRLVQGGLAGSDPQDWFLRSTNIGPPPATMPILDPRHADYGVVQPIARELGMTMLGTLHERIGDTMTVENAGTGSEGPVQSAWGRFFGAQIDNSYQALAKPNANGQLFGFQAGLDLLRFSSLPDQRDAMGLYFAYGNSNLNVSGLVTNAAVTAYVRNRVGTLGLNGYSVGGYWTHYGPGGWYLDGVVQGTIYGGSAQAQFIEPTFTSKLPTDGAGVIMALEAGYPIALPAALGPRFILEPQAQILWQHVDFNQANDGLESIGLGNTSGPTGRVGIRGQWTIAGVNGEVWQPYARANFWRAWGGNAATSFSGQFVPLSEQATWGEVAGGVTFKYTQRLSYYAQFGYQFAITSRTGISGFLGDIGLRYTW